MVPPELLDCGASGFEKPENPKTRIGIGIAMHENQAVI